MSLIAFSIVFMVIAGLMCMMIAIKHMAAAIDGKNKNSGNKAVASPQQQPSPASPQAPAQAVASAGEGELLAVITAAITAMCGSAARVVSFSPILKAPVATSWKFAARIRNAEGFQD